MNFKFVIDTIIASTNMKFDGVVLVNVDIFSKKILISTDDFEAVAKQFGETAVYEPIELTSYNTKESFLYQGWEFLSYTNREEKADAN